MFELLSDDEYRRFSLDDAVLYFYLILVLDDFVHGKEIKSPLSRHAILYGADIKFGNRLNSLRVILLIDYFVSRYNGSVE